MDFEWNLNTEPVAAANPATPVIVEVKTPVREVLELLNTHRTGSLLICRDGVLAGIFTERDALTLAAAGADLDVPIESVMVRDPVTIDAGATVGAAIRKMAEGGYRRLPIVDHKGRPQGLLKVSGIVHYLVEHFPRTIYNLPPEPDTVIQQREGA